MSFIFNLALFPCLADLLKIITLNILCNLVEASIQVIKVNNAKVRTTCKICSKLTIKTPEQHQRHCCGVLVASIQQILHISLVFLLL